MRIIFIMLAMICVTACTNTVEGFGKDMEHTGKEIQKSANS